MSVSGGDGDVVVSVSGGRWLDGEDITAVVVNRDRMKGGVGSGDDVA